MIIDVKVLRFVISNGGILLASIDEKDGLDFLLPMPGIPGPGARFSYNPEIKELAIWSKGVSNDESEHTRTDSE